MAAESRWRGHEMMQDGDGLWRYCDNGGLVSEDPDRDCGHCGLPTTAEGHNGCLGTISGATNACCGHGVECESYVDYPWHLRWLFALRALAAPKKVTRV